MSTRPIDVQAPLPQTPRGKLSAAERRNELQDEIQVLIKERKRVRDDLDALRTELAGLQDAKQLAAENQQLRTENERYRAAGIDPAEYERLRDAEDERLAKEQATWQEFLQKCELLRQRYPDFQACLQSLADLPVSWLRTISALHNGPEFLMWLGRSPQFHTYLSDLKEPAAIRRIQEAADDLRRLGN